jgi:hypothetical protein
MRELIVFLGILALVIGTGGMAKVDASTFGTNITIYDKASDTPPSTPKVGGYEDGEVEPHMINNQSWDLEAFKQSKDGKTLSIIGGFDFKTGAAIGGYVEPIGDLFIKTGSTPPTYGSPGVHGGYEQPIVDATNYGYNYALKFNFGANNVNTYLIYTRNATGATVYDITHGSDGQTYGDVSNPWRIGAGWVTDGVQHTFTYETGKGDAYVSDTGDPLGGDTHNIISGIDLSFLIPAGQLTNPEAWLHLTYKCGNDNLMGNIAASSVPIPASVLLLGTGLLGLVGLRRFRKS